jgi:hypothetical protein
MKKKLTNTQTHTQIKNTALQKAIQAEIRTVLEYVKIKVNFVYMLE